MYIYILLWGGYHETEDAQRTPTPSHISPSILVYDEYTST